MHEHTPRGTYSLTSRQLEVTEIMPSTLSLSLPLSQPHPFMHTHTQHTCMLKHTQTTQSHNWHYATPWAPSTLSLPLTHIHTHHTHSPPPPPHTQTHTHTPHVTHRDPHTHLRTGAHTGTHTHTHVHTHTHTHTQRTPTQEYTHWHPHILARTETDQQATGSWWGNATPWVPPAPPGHCLSQRTKHHCSVHLPPPPPTYRHWYTVI